MISLKKRIWCGGITLVLCTGFIVFVWGWKLFGFGLCSSPDAVFVHNVFVTDTEIVLTGESNYNNRYYQGYTYKIEGTTLRLGLRFLCVIPVSDTDLFSLHIALNNPIQQVVLTGSGGDELLYSVS